MSGCPSPPISTRSTYGEEEARPSAHSANEQTPLLSTHQAKPHRFLGIQILPWLRQRYIAVLITFIGTMVVLLVSNILLGPIWRRQQNIFANNGTHDFRKTVVLISLDGFRADYLERGLTPNFLAAGDSGLRARWMQPSYPTASFPNHWSIITGLFSESHGIVAHEFIQPETGAHFYFKDPDESWDVNWWGGEPLWETAVKKGFKVADLMWPGPATRHGNKPTYSIRFRRETTLQEKADQVLNWIDLPFDERPQLITVHDLLINNVGHVYGPDSPEMDDALADADVFAHAIRAGLASRNLNSIVNVIFLSDHGMAPTHDRQWIYLEDILGKEGANEIEWKFGRPSTGLWLRPGTNVTQFLEKLHRAAAQAPHSFKVYTVTNDAWPNVYHGIDIPPALQNPFPAHMHFSSDHNSRIPPIYIVPEMGWSVTWNRETDPWPKAKKGDHGYDNEDPYMRGFFIASGPFTDRDRITSLTPNRFSRTSPNIYIPKSHNATTKSKPSIYVLPRSGDRTGPVLIDKFQNVEVHGLVMRLLGIRQHSVKTNGTEGFWDEWFDRF